MGSSEGEQWESGLRNTVAGTLSLYYYYYYYYYYYSNFCKKSVPFSALVYTPKKWAVHALPYWLGPVGCGTGGA
jgi:hypothetical protein